MSFATAARWISNHEMTALLLAQENGGVLVRSFVIALVIVAPVALWQWRRIRAGRSLEQASASSDVHPNDAVEPAHSPTLEAVVDSIAELASSTPSGQNLHFEVPDGLLLEGRRAQGAVIDAIVRDALTRGGFEVLARHEAQPGSGWVTCFECRRT